MLLVLSLLTGCDAKTVEPPAAAAAVSPLDPAAVKQHLTQLVERALGGDETAKAALLGYDGVDFGDVSTIEILSVVPGYSAEGKKVDIVKARLQVKGTNKFKGGNLDKAMEKNVFFSNGEYKVL
jgi:hypothetical protein